jgi:hypothetical protein
VDRLSVGQEVPITSEHIYPANWTIYQLGKHKLEYDYPEKLSNVLVYKICDHCNKALVKG